MSVARKLSDVEVLDPDGNPVELGRAWRDRTAVLAFIRHFG
jgi:hypothetical protein